MKTKRDIMLSWKRYLRIHGNSSWITIPPEFLKANGIRPSSVIEIQLLKDGSLRIVPSKVEV